MSVQALYKVDWFIYIVECRDGSLYTGMTNNIPERIRKHNNKLGAVSLRGKLPVRLVYKELCGTKVQAARREREIKGWNRQKKLNLVHKALP